MVSPKLDNALGNLGQVKEYLNTIVYMSTVVENIHPIMTAGYIL